MTANISSVILERLRMPPFEKIVWKTFQSYLKMGFNEDQASEAAITMVLFSMDYFGPTEAFLRLHRANISEDIAKNMVKLFEMSKTTKDIRVSVNG